MYMIPLRNPARQGEGARGKHRECQQEQGKEERGDEYLSTSSDIGVSTTGYRQRAIDKGL